MQPAQSSSAGGEPPRDCSGRNAVVRAAAELAPAFPGGASVARAEPPDDQPLSYSESSALREGDLTRGTESAALREDWVCAPHARNTALADPAPASGSANETAGLSIQSDRKKRNSVSGTHTLPAAPEDRQVVAQDHDRGLSRRPV
jgi:hypothetical protein